MSSEHDPQNVTSTAAGETNAAGETMEAGDEPARIAKSAAAGEASALVEPAAGTEPVSQAIIIERTELFLETYSGIAEWIKFADAKAAVVLTINGAIASLLIPTLRDFRSAADLQNPLFLSASVAFALWLSCMVASGVYSLLCILPVRIRNRHPSIGHCSNFHPAAISAAYTINDQAKFVSDCTQGTGADFERQVLSSVLFDAHISSIKYSRVSVSIKCFALSAIAGFVYLFLIQFLNYVA